MQIDMDFITIVGVLFTVFGTLIAFYSVWKSRKNTTVVHKNDSITSRFIALFESHGVHRNQIPDFFGHGITLHECADETELLNKLDSQCLNDAAELFGVNLEWLQGASTEIYDIPSFYKDNNACDVYLANLKNTHSKDNFSAYVLRAKKKKKHLLTIFLDLIAYVLSYKTDIHNRDRDNAVFLITEVIGHINEREIYRYHLAGKIQNNYWKARAYFAVSCALLIKHGFQPIGQTVNEQWLISLNEGKTLIEYDFTEGWQHFILPNSRVWYVDEFLECPEKYLAGVDPERDNFGHISALQMWLEFKHFMKADGRMSYEESVAAFENKLKKLT